MIFHHGGIPFEDINIEFSKWPEIKQKGEICHFGQLPSLQLPDGRIISQSGAIVRYAASVAGLYPREPEAAAEADMLLELSQDMNAINPILNWHVAGGEEWTASHDRYFKLLPQWMTAAQKILGEKEYFGGETPHFGDFGLFHIVNNTLTVSPQSLDSFPAILAWSGRMLALESVQKYFSERPHGGTPNWGRPGSFITTHKLP